MTYRLPCPWKKLFALFIRVKMHEIKRINKGLIQHTMPPSKHGRSLALGHPFDLMWCHVIMFYGGSSDKVVYAFHTKPMT